jgi:putative hydrolase of the HAD superfamily
MNDHADRAVVEVARAGSPISSILFDAGGTIVFPNFRRIAAELAEGAAVDPGIPEKLARADALIRFELDRPEVVGATNDHGRFRRYMAALAREAGYASLSDGAFARLDEYHRTHNLWEDVPAEVPRALNRLRDRFRMGVVSNANGTVRAKLERVGLAGFFEIIVDSHEEGVEKPDPRIFHIALNRMGIAAGETAYVGDLYHVDIVGAAAAGLKPYLLDPHDLHAARAVTRIRSIEALGL